MPKLEKGDAEFVASTILGFVAQEGKGAIREFVLWLINILLQSARCLRPFHSYGVYLATKMRFEEGPKNYIPHRCLLILRYKSQYCGCDKLGVALLQLRHFGQSPVSALLLTSSTKYSRGKMVFGHYLFDKLLEGIQYIFVVALRSIRSITNRTEGRSTQVQTPYLPFCCSTSYMDQMPLKSATFAVYRFCVLVDCIHCVILPFEGPPQAEQSLVRKGEANEVRGGDPDLVSRMYDLLCPAVTQKKYSFRYFLVMVPAPRFCVAQQIRRLNQSQAKARLTLATESNQAWANRNATSFLSCHC